VSRDSKPKRLVSLSGLAEDEAALAVYRDDEEETLAERYEREDREDHKPPPDRSRADTGKLLLYRRAKWLEWKSQRTIKSRLRARKGMRRLRVRNTKPFGSP
jgi:hypothetical protein